MMEPADAGKRDDLPSARRLDGSGNRRVLLEPEVRATLVKIVDVGPNDPPELASLSAMT